MDICLCLKYKNAMGNRLIHVVGFKTCKAKVVGIENGK